MQGHGTGSGISVALWPGQGWIELACGSFGSSLPLIHSTYLEGSGCPRTPGRGELLGSKILCSGH